MPLEALCQPAAGCLQPLPFPVLSFPVTGSVLVPACHTSCFPHVWFLSAKPQCWLISYQLYACLMGTHGDQVCRKLTVYVNPCTCWKSACTLLPWSQPSCMPCRSRASSEVSIVMWPAGANGIDVQAVDQSFPRAPETFSLTNCGKVLCLVKEDIALHCKNWINNNYPFLQQR